MDNAIPSVLVNDPRFSSLAALTDRFRQAGLERLLVYLVDIVNADVLPHLASQFHITDEGYLFAETDEAKRELIKSAIEIHRHKGTPWAVKRVFELLGLGKVELLEGRGGYKRDGTVRRNGYAVRGDRTIKWADYRVICHSLLSVKQAALAREILDYVAPARSRLVGIDFTDATLIRNGVARRDGSYTRGMV